MTDAKNQAKAQAEHITALIAALNCDFDRLEELRDKRDNYTALNSDGYPTMIHADWAKDNPEDSDELTQLETEAGEFSDIHQVTEAIQESPLSVEVRSGWHSYGDKPTLEEFRIVLCTGGPAVQIRGEFDVHGNAYRAWLEYQDWGTPWTQYFDADQETLVEYASQFCFEGWTMNTEKMADLANEAANEAIRHIQDKLGVKTGDFAGLYFSGGDNWNALTTILFDYIYTEISEGMQPW